MQTSTSFSRLKNSRVALGSTSQAARKIVARDLQRAQLLGCNAVVSRGTDDRKRRRAIMPTSCPSRFEIGADEAVRMFGDLRQVNVSRERHGAGMNFKNL